MKNKTIKTKEIEGILNKEASAANEHYKFHKENGDKYNLSQWFNGQRALVRKLKSEIKKLGNDKTQTR